MSQPLEAETARPRIIAPILAAVPVFLVLCGLGVWQVERLAWKEDMIERIDARIHATPTPLPPADQWATLATRDYDYTHVSVNGRYKPGVEALVFRGAGHVGNGPAEPGYWIMAPFQVTGGGVLLVNRGFVALNRRADPRRAPIAAETTIAGLLRAPETRNPFTPPDNPAKGEWFTRDPIAIAAALNIAEAAPFSLDEDAHPVDAGLPAGGATVLDIPNNHLSYAATWFGLAATLVGVLGLYVFRARRKSS